MEPKAAAEETMEQGVLWNFLRERKPQPPNVAFFRPPGKGWTTQVSSKALWRCLEKLREIKSIRALSGVN